MVSRKLWLENLTTATLVISAALLPLQVGASPMLHGHVEEPAIVAPEQTQQESAPLLQQKLIENSFPQSYQGSYHCVTTVTESGVSTVPVGQIMHSDIDFVRTADGRITEHWNQTGWTETQSSITAFNERESRVDRTSYFFGENMQGAWAARARDQFTQVSEKQLLARSYVDQYLDGQYLGRYHTTSVLQKNEIALAK